MTKQQNIWICKLEDLNTNIQVQNKRNIRTNRPALEMDKDHKYVQEFVQILKKLDMKTEYKGVNYFTDLSLTMPELPKPFIIMVRI